MDYLPLGGWQRGFTPRASVSSLIRLHVYKLKKALYGLKQAPRAWYGRLTTYITEHEMRKMFEMSIVSELTYFLGLQVKQTDFGIYINQIKYARNLVKRFGLEKADNARTPMAANAKLTNNPSSESVDVTLYRSMIGCLLYLTARHPDIAFSVGVYSRFQSNPKVSHLNAVKRIIKYVSGTCDYGLFYTKESNMSLARYSNADWAGNANDRKSTTGGCFYVGANLVAWMSKKQNYVSLSTTKVEYIAARSCCS